MTHQMMVKRNKFDASAKKSQKWQSTMLILTAHKKDQLRLLMPSKRDPNPNLLNLLSLIQVMITTTMETIPLKFLTARTPMHQKPSLTQNQRLSPRQA
jgi:hypothetical protein